MPFSHKLRLAILGVTLAATVGCDQTSKHLARSELGQRGFITLPGGFGELRLAENPGSFLSLGDSLPEPLRLMLFSAAVGVGLLGLLAYLALSRGLTSLSFVGLALAWAGGTSNLVDRIMRHGLVSDFIFLRAGPLHTGIFNLADVVIMAGFAVLLFDLWKRQRRRSPVQ
jgi:signal peptidase II